MPLELHDIWFDPQLPEYIRTTLPTAPYLIYKQIPNKKHRDLFS